MIGDLSLSLRAMLAQTDAPPELANAHIVFDHPTESFAPSQTTVNLFLYDIREDMELRTSEPTVDPAKTGATIRPPALRIACSYLVTAWPVGGEELALQEHRLLSQALAVLRRYPTIPETFLQGALRGQQPPLPLIAAQGDAIKDPNDFWTAIGNKLRPSITVKVTVPLLVSEPAVQEVGIVQLHDVRIARRPTPDGPTSPPPARPMATIGGRVLDANEAPARGLSLTLKQSNLSAATDAEGRYILRRVLHGAYTLQVRRDGVLVKELPISVPAAKGQGYDLRLG